MRNLNKNQKIAVALSLLVVGFFFVFGGGLVGIMSDNQTSSNDLPIIETRDLVVGQGDEVFKGDKVSLNYSVSLPNGQLIESSQNTGPIIFILGDGSVIEGLNEGVLGMKVGGQRLIIVPPELGYGNNAIGPIPAGSSLIFEVNLVSRERVLP